MGNGVEAGSAGAALSPFPPSWVTLDNSRPLSGRRPVEWENTAPL